MSTNPSSEESLNWRREESIDLPMPETEGRLAIRHQDWTRLKTRVQRIDDQGLSLSVIYSILFGVAGSAGLSIIPIASTKDLPSWVTPLYICVFLFSLLCAIVFVMVERKYKSRTQTAQLDVIEEMTSIEGTFIRKKGGRVESNIISNTAITNPEAQQSIESGGTE